MDHGVIILTIILSANPPTPGSVCCHGKLHSEQHCNPSSWPLMDQHHCPTDAPSNWQSRKKYVNGSLAQNDFSQHVFPSDLSFVSQSDYHAWIRRVKTHKYDSFASSSLFWWLPEKWRSTLKRCRNSLLPNTFRKTAQLGRWCKCIYVSKVLTCGPKYQDI